MRIYIYIYLYIYDHICTHTWYICTCTLKGLCVYNFALLEDAIRKPAKCSSAMCRALTY